MRPALELLWLDPKSCPRMRRKPAWQRVLDEARASQGPAAHVPELPYQAASPEDRADVFEILARAERSDGTAVRAAVAAGIRADGKFASPLLVVEGELVFAFDELELLKGLIANAIPFADDKDLQAAVSAAKEYVSLPGLLPTPAAVEALARRIREAFARAPRGVAADFLDTQTERALLDHRKYQTRVFHGAPHLRVLLRQRSDEAPLLAFAPADVATRLPLERQLAARLVVEAHVFSDQYDPHSIALEILAVARRVSQPVQGTSDTR